MQISLDGVVSDPEKWMNLSDEIMEDALEYYDTLDLVVMGSQTYPSIAAYWQAAEQSSTSPLVQTFAKKIKEMKKLVISRSSVNLLWKNSKQLEFKAESFVNDIEKLKKEKGKNISVESGVKTWQLFLEHGLFDELKLYVHPVVAGQGQKLFIGANEKIKLEVLNTRVYKNGVVEFHYQKKRNN